jgi:predicted Kef-type K+ transport protein
MKKDQSLKEFFKKALQKKRKHRFLSMYQHFHHYLSENLLIKLSLAFLGSILLGVGIILLFIPGPGILFILLGAGLFCIISKKMVQLMDIVEKKLWKNKKKTRQKEKST